VRQQQETAKIREVLIMQDTIERFANPDVYNDFRNGSNGACQLDERDLKFLEKFPKYVQPKRPAFSNETPFSSSLKMAAEHLSNVVDGRQRPFLDSGYSYEEIKELFDKIQLCGYFDKDITIVPDENLDMNKELNKENLDQNVIESDLESDDKKVTTSESVVVVKDAVADVKPKVEAPAATQVPAPAFPQQVVPQAQPMQQPMAVPVPIVQQSQLPGIPAVNAPTNVRAVEHGYYKVHIYTYI
jgi:caprin-1